MRILYTSRVDSLHRGGLGEFHHNKLEAEILRRGWDMTILTSAVEANQSEDFIIENRGIQTVFLGNTTPDTLDKDFKQAAIKFIRRNEPFDIAFYSAFSGVGVSRQMPTETKSLHFLHNSWSTMRSPFDTTRLGSRKWLSLQFRKWLWKRNLVVLAASKERIAVPSHFTRKALLIDAGNLGIKLPEERICVAHNGLAKSPTAHLDLTQTFPPERHPSLLSIGRIHPQKGLETLLRAAAELRNRASYFTLTIIGPVQDLDYFQFLRRLTDDLELDSVTTFEPGKTPKEVEESWNTADLAIFPSLFDEGLSFALLEAMRAGVVPIASKSGGNVEVLFGDLEILLFDKGDHRKLAEIISGLITNPEKARELSSKVKQRVGSDFSLSNHLDKLVKCAD